MDEPDKGQDAASLITWGPAVQGRCMLSFGRRAGLTVPAADRAVARLFGLPCALLWGAAAAAGEAPLSAD